MQPKTEGLYNFYYNKKLEIQINLWLIMVKWKDKIHPSV